MTTTDSRSAATTGEGVNADRGTPEGIRVDESGTAPQGRPNPRPAALQRVLDDLTAERFGPTVPPPAAGDGWRNLRTLADETRREAS